MSAATAVPELLLPNAIAGEIDPVRAAQMARKRAPALLLMSCVMAHDWARIMARLIALTILVILSLF